MTKNGIALSVVAVVLAVIYVIYFTDWFSTRTIQIYPMIRPSQASGVPRDVGMPAVYPVAFAFDGRYRLNLVKVVVEEDLRTNHHPQPLWHLVSEIGSPPQKSITYGKPIKNMKPALPRARPQSLVPNVRYVLQVQSGEAQGQTNFFTKEAVQPTP
ncbi:MAG: hypothetical protein JXQ71_01575 [Verrucomicrobia bacterium]|nr:hypothetical protein [Verrucomicrobiota bacterium]